MPKISAERLRDYHGPITNTDIWDGFELRADDIYVDTPPKCGTTWMLNIVMMLIHGRAVPDAGNSRDAPWLDVEFRDRQEIATLLKGMKRRRCIKSHTPMDGIAYAKEPTYIVVYRHPVDAHFSLRTHAGNMKTDWLDHLFEGDERTGFKRFVDGALTESGTDDFTVASIVQHYQEARKRQPNGNVHFFHYADMTGDLAGQTARLANILNISLDASVMAEIVEATTFKSMRKAVETSTRRFHKDTPFHDLADFYASGTSNKWEGRLTGEDMEAYATRVSSLLPEKDVAWLQWGDQGHP